MVEMNIALLHLNSNSNSNGDIENNVNDNTIRIDNDNNRSLLDLIKEDRSLVMFLIVLGLYIDDDRNSRGIKILARLWQCCLLVSGGIGFMWATFIEGGYWISYLHKTLSSSTPTSTDIFIGYGTVLGTFVVPLVQVASLMYGVYNVYKQMKHQTVNVDIVSKHLASSKKTAIVFFICMALLVIAIDPIIITRSVYNDFNDDYYLNKTAQKNYSLFSFCQLTTGLFYNLVITCYLTVMLFFTSVSLKQINTLQEYVIRMIDTDNLITDRYMDAKDMIMSLKNGYYLSTQLLTITAAINVIGFMFYMWLGSYYYNNLFFTLRDTLLYDFVQFPYLLKGDNYYYHYHHHHHHHHTEIIFFFYVLYLAASINTLHDRFIEIANKKFWEIKKRIDSSNSNSVSVYDQQLLWSYTMIHSEDYSLFKLGQIEVRREGVIGTMILFIAFCLYMLLKFKKIV